MIGQAVLWALYRVGVVASALAVGGFFGFFAFGLGLVMPAVVARPLAYFTTAVYAALGAAWAANALAPDRTRTRLIAAVAVSLAAAVAVALVDLALLLTIATEGSAAAAVLGIWLLLALVASGAAWSARAGASHLRRDALLTLAIAVGAIAFVAGSVAVTCSVARCGA